MKINEPKNIWFCIYIFSNIIALIIMMNSNKLIGDVAANSIQDSDNLFVALFFVIFSYFFVLVFLFNIIKKVRINKIKYEDHIENKIYRVIGFLILIFQIFFIFFNINNGINIAGSANVKAESVFSFFWVFLPIDALFIIYYGVARGDKFFKLNLIIYVISNVMRGWSSVFFLLVFMEWCYAYRNNKINYRYVFSCLFILILIYPYLNIVKYFFRSYSGVFSLDYLVEIYHINYGNISYFESITLGLTRFIERVQTTSILAVVIEIKDRLYLGYINGVFSPFWKEGLHGIFIDRFLGNEKSMPLGVAFTNYAIFDWDFEIGSWNTNTGFASWFFIAPYLIPFYLFYTIFVCFISYFLIKKISSKAVALDLLWFIWLIYIMPPWFGTFIQFIYALFLFLFLKFSLGFLIKKYKV